MAHIVKLLDDLEFRTPAEFDGRSKGYTTDAVVNEPGGGVQMGFRVSRLDAGGAVEAHVQSFEESIYVMEGSLVLDTVEGSTEMVAGDYGLVPVGMTHALPQHLGRARVVRRDAGAAAARAVRLRHAVPRAARRSRPGPRTPSTCAIHAPVRSVTSTPSRWTRRCRPRTAWP